ncbi:hypothetical protein BpHYR1_049553 [Brachionus plicatilis]|uniref:Uncharacterized protein n=1 Tax=Brachionus plicatilis TaxID=10195 RepID=A0A3M7SB55_BRAPC|nr:hypothetical protein BpHYR1_049553 [Brachionus plicatilis]
MHTPTFLLNDILKKILINMFLMKNKIKFCFFLILIQTFFISQTYDLTFFLSQVNDLINPYLITIKFISKKSFFKIDIAICFRKTMKKV